MSNFLAVATVTASLRAMLHAAVGADVPGASASTLRPGDAAIPSPGVNVYLYQVLPCAAWQNEDLPTRSPGGQVVQRPRAALELHYLLSFHGDEAQLEPQRVLGSAVRTLHARPVLTRDAVRATIADAAFDFLAESDLADEVELVRVTPMPLSLEELSRVWSVFFQVPYNVSAAYRASVVLVESADTPVRALPVRVRDIVAAPFQRARIDEVVPADPSRPGVEPGDTVVLRGARLAGRIERVRVGAAELAPVPGSVEPERMEVTLDDPALRAGLLGVQVAYEGGAESSVAPLVLRPRVAVDQAAVTAAVIPVELEPPVGRRQRVKLLLNEAGVADPRSHLFDAPADNGIADPDDETTGRIEFPIAGVGAGTWLVRVTVSGAESLLETDLATGRYVGPVAVVP